MYVTYSRREMEENRKFYEMMYDPSHHLVKMDRVVDWDFVSKQLAVFYPHRIGRPTKDPILLVKTLLIQHVEGFRSVRFTETTRNVTLVFRHFSNRQHSGSLFDDSHHTKLEKVDQTPLTQANCFTPNI